MGARAYDLFVAFFFAVFGSPAGNFEACFAALDYVGDFEGPA